MSNIFKAYDVRGIYPDEINKEIAYRIGFATIKFLQIKNPGKKLNLIVGEDCRIASPILRGAVIDATTKAGADIYYIGQCTTPLFYFSVNKLKADGGIMITASHNPPQYGGLKIAGFESRPVGSENGLKDIEAISKGELEAAKQVGKIEETNLVNDYVDFVIKKSGINLKKLQNLKVVVDSGNGMTPIVLKPLFEKTGLAYTPLYFEIDCNFPNHSPDISKAEALTDLRNKVIETGSDLGVAFDGDGDRVFFIDEKGEIVRSEYILALLYQEASHFFHKPKTVYDLRISRSIKELFGSRGIKSRPGHSFIKQIMRQYDSDLGGELSGHFFFKEMKYAESSVLVMLNIMKIMNSKTKPMSKLIEPFKKYFHSGEISLEIESGERGIKIMSQLKEEYKNEKIDELDGVTVDAWENSGFWFNARLSNTEPVLRLVIESKTEELLGQKIKELIEKIKSRTF